MMFTSEMVHLAVVVLKERAEAVEEQLLESGAVQFHRLGEINPQLGTRLKDAGVDERRSAVVAVRGRIEQILQLGGYAPPIMTGVPPGGTDIDLADIHRGLDQLARDVERFRNRQAEIQREIHRIGNVRRHLAGWSDALASQKHRFLDIRYGSLPAAAIQAVDREVGRLSGLVIETGSDEQAVTVLVVAMKRNSVEVEELLAAHGFRAREMPRMPEGVDALDEAEGRVRRLEREQAEQGERIRAIISDRREVLEEQWKRVRIQELLLTIRSHTSESTHAAVLSGWVPARSREWIDAAIHRAAGNRCHVEWHSPLEMQESGYAEIPVELRNPRFLKPFQLLVTNYGVPEYGTIDPTPLVAVAYLLMFGLMFGDAGHGLVLVVLGVLGARFMRSPTYRRLSRLLVWCGGASVVTGVLFGAYFGYELLPPVWFNVHAVVAGHPQGGAVRNLLDILKMTLYLGITVIGLGLFLNWVNRVRRREWRALVFEKEGLLGGGIYAAGVWIADSFARSSFRSLPNLSAVGPLLAVALAILFVKYPLDARDARRAGKRGDSPAMWVMDWTIELLEIFSGYLANTLSFMRVAGLGIAHVMLLIAFFQIADMVSPGRTTFLSVLILLFGNVLVIALEGLSAGIQSLRLNYYEFFSKYFTPTGSVYRPVSLENSAQGD